MKHYRKKLFRPFILLIQLVILIGTYGMAAAPLGELSGLVDAAWLQDNLKKVQVLDVRNELEDGVIPGSIHAPYKIWRSTDPANPGEIPSLSVLTENAEKLGLDLSTPYVIVFAGKNSTDFGSAARVYWTLKYLGFKRLAILNGGLKAYRDLGGSGLDTDPVTPKPISGFTPAIQKQYFVGNEEVVDTVNAGSDDPEKGFLLDSRNDDQYGGKTKHPAAPRFGAIAGSKQLWQGEWFIGDSAELKNLAELEAVAAGYQIPTDRVIFVYCNTGHWAASNWFVLSELLHLPNVKLYPDSFVKYSQLADAQIINEPSRFTKLWWEIKGWFNN